MEKDYSKIMGEMIDNFIASVEKQDAPDTNVGNNDGWILASEPPKERETVIISTPYATFAGCYYCGNWYRGELLSKDNTTPIKKVIAWRHLPEPYKQGVYTNFDRIKAMNVREMVEFIDFANGLLNVTKFCEHESNGCWSECPNSHRCDDAPHELVEQWLKAAVSGEKRKQTNADIIRSMSDEELAEFLYEICDSYLGLVLIDAPETKDFCKYILEEFLRKENEE